MSSRIGSACFLISVLGCLAATPFAAAAAPAPAPNEGVLGRPAKIPLGNVSGRIDHMALDQQRQILYVAELGNNSIGVLDLRSGKVVRRITGLSEPQGVAYVPSSDLLFVANGGDGSVRWFRGSDGSSVGAIDLGDDADNLHIDPSTARVYVGYGGGGVAVLDGSTGRKLGEVAVGGHPEGFSLDASGPSVFVNVPARKAIVVFDRSTLAVTATWTVKEAGQNFPAELDGPAARFLTVLRAPSALAVYSTRDGSQTAQVSVCDDADDLFFDGKRQRLYVSCGAGFIDVFDAANPAFPRIARVATVAGARTELLVPETDQLFLAVRAAGAEPAAVWIFKPVP